MAQKKKSGKSAPMALEMGFNGLKDVVLLLRANTKRKI
jgi:hypothetical protein